VNGLPSEAATWREGRDPWSQTDHFLASLLEVSDGVGRQLALLRGVKPHKLGPPLQIPRPGGERRKKVETDPAAIRAFFTKHFGGG
jgi:hypothetical protein